VLDLLVRLMRLSKQEISVVCVVVVFHVFLGVYLAALLNGGENISRGNETALIVHWIKRDSIDTRPANPLKSPVTRTQPSSHTMRSSREHVAIQESPEQVSQSPAPRPIDLEPPRPKISFDRNPLERPTRLDTTPSLLSVTFIDRSVGGTLQRMTKSQNCKELRKALATTSGDATTIMASMEKEGCIRS
jgi:hypothetical protein